jgi:hypothetical protein
LEKWHKDIKCAKVAGKTEKFINFGIAHQLWDTSFENCVVPLCIEFFVFNSQKHHFST